MSIGGKVYQNAAADDVAATEHVELVLAIDGIRDDRSVGLDLPAAVPVSAERDGGWRQPRTGGEGDLRRLQAGIRSKPAGRSGEEARHGDRPAAGHNDFTAEIGQ